MAENDPKKSNYVNYTWIHNALDTPATGSSLYLIPAVLAGHSHPYVIAPFDGSIVAISGYMQNLVGTGSLTVYPMIEGVTVAAGKLYWKTATASHTRDVYASFARGAYTFVAGDRLGVSYTSSTGFDAGASGGVSIQLLVHYEMN